MLKDIANPVIMSALGVSVTYAVALVGLEFDEIQMRQGHWVVVDLIGKGGHIRTVPNPEWVKAALDQWMAAARVTEGRIFRAVARTGKVWGKGISQNVVWYVVKTCCERAGLDHIAPHDLRRTCAKLCHSSGGELEQIQFLLGHASLQTTERYLGCKQNLGHPSTIFSASGRNFLGQAAQHLAQALLRHHPRSFSLIA